MASGAVPIQQAGGAGRCWHEAGPLLLRTGQGRAAAGHGPVQPGVVGRVPEPTQPLTLSPGPLTGPCWEGGGDGLLQQHPVPPSCQCRRHFPRWLLLWQQGWLSHSCCPLALLTVIPALHPSHYCCVVGAECAGR